MGRRVRVAAALVICLLGLVACGFGDRPAGLPDPPEDTPGAAPPPLPSTLEVYGPARVDLKEFYFEETGQDTIVDLERSHPRATTDLSYDHFTGVLAPINGAEVWLYRKKGFWGEPGVRSDYPGERQCTEKPEGWLKEFGEDDLQADFSIYCIRTAEKSVGFLYIKPIENQKPNAYYVYAYTWVR